MTDGGADDTLVLRCFAPEHDGDAKGQEIFTLSERTVSYT